MAKIRDAPAMRAPWITDWPTPTQQAKGRVIEILGYEDDFGVDVEIIIRKHHLPHRFPVDVLEQAQAF